jgi:hypothetical protein
MAIWHTINASLANPLNRVTEILVDDNSHKTTFFPDDLKAKALMFPGKKRGIEIVSTLDTPPGAGRLSLHGRFNCSADTHTA